MRLQHPFEDLRYARPTLRLTFQEGIQLLRDAGYDGACSFVCPVRVVNQSGVEGNSTLKIQVSET